MTDNKKSIFKGVPVIIIIVILGIVALIVFLKIETTEPSLSVEQQRASDSTASMAVPDTSVPDLETLSSEVFTVEQETDEPVASDSTSVSADRRPAHMAGYEDGYIAGQEDAAMRQYKATYDETNAFMGEESKVYNEHYRRGYEEGFRHKKTPVSASSVEDQE